MLRGCGNDDVGKSRRMSQTTRPIRHRAGDPRSCHIEGKNSIIVKVQDRIEPRCQIGALARGPLAPRLSDSILDLRDCDGRYE